MNLFRAGKFKLSGGRESSYKIDCDVLLSLDYVCLAGMITKLVPPFSSVEGVPQGGLALAEAMMPHITAGANRLLVVDDVLTTGGSIERVADVHRRPGREVIGAVIFARGPCPNWVWPLFELHEDLWAE